VESSVGLRRRAAALVSLTSASASALALAIILLRHGLSFVIALGGLVLAVWGGWWLVSEPMPRRLVGVAGVAAGVAGVVVGVMRAINGTSDIMARVAIVLGLVFVAAAAARWALRSPVDPLPAGSGGVLTPKHAELLCNPRSGGGKVAQFHLVELAEEMGVEVVMLDDGLDLEQLARDAVARGADCLGMAGGDGSQALVASIAIEHDLPHVCVSAGTRNHFALDLGLDRDDPRASMAAFRDGVNRRVDYATVNGRLFVNNVSLGVYATILQEDSYRESKANTTAALLPELLGSQAEPFDLQFETPDGEQVDGAFLVQVSNNPYVVGASLDAAQRHRLDSGALGVLAVSTANGRDAAALMTLALAGQAHRSPYWHEFTADRFQIDARSGSAFVGIDGEASEMPTPLRFEIHPAGLRLLVPRGNLQAAARRKARDVRVADLVAVAAGHDPA
jgi:diacylglycerol kinase family enzyme